MRKDEYDCEIDMNALQSFKTGRVDCQPDANADRPFYTSRPEIHPNANANGETTVNYYKENFGITAREAIALTEGAHAYGKPNREVSLNSYSWTDNQELLLNNQMFRELVQEDQWVTACRDGNANNKELKLIGMYLQLCMFEK